MKHVVRVGTHHADDDIESMLIQLNRERQAEVKRVLARTSEIHGKKELWLHQYDLIGEYVHLRKQNFLGKREPGAFLHDRVFDSKGPQSAMRSTSAFLSMLWPQEVKKFRFQPAFDIQEDTDVKEYYEKITKVQERVMENPEAGLATTLEESTHDSIVFGTDGVEVFRDEETKVGYRPWSVKEMSIEEGRRGQVDTLALRVMWPVSRIVKTYGFKRMPLEIQKLWSADKFSEEFEIEILIEPRDMAQNLPNAGNRAMPWSSTHVLCQFKHILKQSGFDEIPIKVTRFWKFIGERYGRSPAMNALADILEVNTIWESVTIAIEKNLDPPLGILDDGTLGGGEVDTSAGGMTVFNVSGRAGEKNPIFPLFTVGEIKQTVALIEALDESIANSFMVDVLLDFNNDTEMTLGEANIRNRLRNSTLGTIFFRQIKEKYTPIIQNTFNILFDIGEMGVIRNSTQHRAAEDAGKVDIIIIPDSVAKRMVAGEDVYRIEYFTPAMRILQAEEAEGILRSWEFVGTLKSFGIESAGDVLDVDESIRRIVDITGGPSEIKVAKDVVKQIRVDRGKRQEAQDRQAAQLQQAQTAAQLANSNLI